MNNPLLLKFETPFETVPFNKIKNEHFLVALKEAITRGKEDISKIKTNPEKPTFSNVCEALEKSGGYVDVVAGVFFNLHSAESDDELQGIAKEFSPMLTEYSNDIQLDEELFLKVKEVYEQKNKLNLSIEEMMLVEKQYKGFSRNGALLNEEQKNKLRDIDKELSHLKLSFGDNVLKESNEFEMILDNESDLEGLPEGVVEAAQGEAKTRKYDGKWAFTLDYPSFIPFMTYSAKRELREKMFKAFSSKAFKGNEFDNQENIKRIACLRYDRAKLLGYESHAHFVLEERMASHPDKVFEFLNNLLDHAHPCGEREMNELRDYAKEHGHSEEMQKWDYAYWSERLKKDKYEIDDEILKPYFKLENVIDGVFLVASKLYGTRFIERKDIPVYHEDVKAFEVVDELGKHVGVFYADFFPRTGKRNGAWMTAYREQHIANQQDVRPHISIVCNFTKPTETKPSLLTFNEVTTLFHEFGHALHGLLSKCRYKTLSGTSVYWDFVELPSQIMENWAYEKECLDLFATHYKTGEKIPAELVEKIRKSSTFHEGRHTLRQIGFSTLDLAWHSQDPSGIESVGDFEVESTKGTDLLPHVDGTSFSCAFSHIFQGGYSSGYYSYKWAEVLDADAFELFKKEGILSRSAADKFRTNILEKGGSEHPMELYKKFRGHEPTPEALLRRAGLIN